MPAALEKALAKAAAKKGIKKNSKRWGAFVYGAMRKTGWVPSTQKKEAPKK